MTTSDWIALSSAVFTLLGVFVAGGALRYTHLQWQKVKAKIGMIDNYSKAAEVLPAWYTGRMMSDWWLFGLYMQCSDADRMAQKRVFARVQNGHERACDTLGS